jgi:hypothetical protein
MSNETMIPFQGGQLVTAPSAQVGGRRNYSWKLNFRRDSGDEMRIPGWDWFPNDPGSFGSDVILIAEVVRPNTDHAIIVATATTIYRFDAGPNNWKKIGSGYDPDALPWEAADVNGYLVFNNGSDLPFTYREEDAFVSPIHELREKGVARVGTIANFLGFLVCGDISEIAAEKYDDFVSDVPSYTEDGTFYGRITDETILTHTPYRHIWSDQGEPRRWKLTLTGSGTTGGTTITLNAPTSAIVTGDEVDIGVDTSLPVTFISLDGLTIHVGTSLTQNYTDEPVVRSTFGSELAGADDTYHDGSRIIKLAALDDRLVSFRTTSIFIGSTTGDAAAPVVFDHAYTGPDVLYYPRCVASVEGSYLLFRGRYRIYRFDKLRRAPEIFPKLDIVRNLMTVASPYEPFAAINPVDKEVWFVNPEDDDTTVVFHWETESAHVIDSSFAAAAGVINPWSDRSPSDLWFVMSSFATSVDVDEGDPAYCPEREQEEVCVIPEAVDPVTSRIILNGINCYGEEIYTRFGESYNSVLQSCLDHLDGPMVVQIFRRLMVMLSSKSPDTAGKIEVLRATNATDTPASKSSRDFTSMNAKNALPTHVLGEFIADRITLSGGAAKITMRTWDYGRKKGRTVGRV